MIWFNIGCVVAGWLALGFAIWLGRVVLNALLFCDLQTNRMFRDILCGLFSLYLILAELQKDLDGSQPLTPAEAVLLEQPPTQL